MPAVIDPVSGLELYELSHRWRMYTPIFPGYEEIKLERITHHAKQGVMTHKITTIFHTSTHLNAPIHLVPIVLGSAQFIPGFEDNLIGLKAGESRPFNLKFPDPHPPPS